MKIIKKIYFKIRHEYQSLLRFLSVYFNNDKNCYIIFSLPKTGNRTLQKAFETKKKNYISWHFFFENLIEKRKFIFSKNLLFLKLLNSKKKISVFSIFRDEFDIYLSYFFYQDFIYLSGENKNYIKKKIKTYFNKKLNYNWSKYEFEKVFKFNPLKKIKNKKYIYIKKNKLDFHLIKINYLNTFIKKNLNLNTFKIDTEVNLIIENNKMKQRISSELSYLKK